MNLNPTVDVEPGLSSVTYSNEIEAEVDGVYKQLYDENMSIDDVVTMLQRYKESTNPHENEIFACMVHLLFDEYKFFQTYPPRELAMTGYLFGSIIAHSLVDHIPLGIAMRYIIDALNWPPDTNLFKFGLQALNRFEYRLASPQWRPLCESLSMIGHLAEARPDLYANIRRILSSPPGPDVPEQTAITYPVAFEPVPTFASIRPDAVSDTLEEPPEELSDRILFIVNNLAPNNFDTKVEDMRQQFVDQYSRWFAHYLVDQRVSTEPNNHGLYIRFLDALDRQPLWKLILQESFVKAAALLNSDGSVAGPERNALKNVGTWLGSITLARDVPIRHKNLAFKDLLIEGFENNRLIVAIPFVCKTLEPCAKSKVFRPPNPWLMAVIGLLAELYSFAELKLNLKFDIEILCKSLQIDLDTVEPTTILRNRPLDNLTGLSMPEYSEDISLHSLNEGGAQNDSQILALGGQNGTENRVLSNHIEAILVNLGQMVQINPQLAPYGHNPTFKQAVRFAIDRAVREVCRSSLLSFLILNSFEDYSAGR